jgi:hypothetical protein
VRARLEIEAQGPGRFHAVEIQHLGFMQHRQIAGLAEIGHQPRENRVTQAPRAGMHHHAQRELREARADHIGVLLPRLADHQAAGLQRSEHAM